MKLHYFIPVFLIILMFAYFPLSEYSGLNREQILTVLVTIGLFFILATEYRHRTVASLTSLAFLWSLGILSGEEIAHYVEFDVLGLLFGMMVIVETLREAGFISILTRSLISLRIKSFHVLLIFFSLLTFILSAFLANATVMLIVVPIALELCDILHSNPIPVLIVLNVSSNLGGIITPVGDPPNIMITSHLGVSFSEFMLNTAPPSLLSYIISLAFLFSLHRKDLVKQISSEVKVGFEIEDKKLFFASVPTLIIVILLFLTESMTGLKPAAAALYGAIFLLIVGGEKMNSILKRVDWDLLIFMGSMIAFSGALERVGIIHLIAQAIISITEGNGLLLIAILTWISSIFSAFVDNIPYTAVMIPMLDELIGHSGLDFLWWVLAISVGIGGVGTPIASAPSLITYSVLKEKYEFRFSDFMRMGLFLVIVLSFLNSLYYAAIYLFCLDSSGITCIPFLLALSASSRSKVTRGTPSLSAWWRISSSSKSKGSSMRIESISSSRPLCDILTLESVTIERKRFLLFFSSKPTPLENQKSSTITMKGIIHSSIDESIFLASS